MATEAVVPSPPLAGLAARFACSKVQVMALLASLQSHAPGPCMETGSHLLLVDGSSVRTRGQSRKPHATLPTGPARLALVGAGATLDWGTE